MLGFGLGVLFFPKAPSDSNSRLLGYVTIGYIEPSSHYLGNWSPRVWEPLQQAMFAMQSLCFPHPRNCSVSPHEEDYRASRMLRGSGFRASSKIHVRHGVGRFRVYT